MTSGSLIFGCLFASVAGVGCADVAPKKKLIECGWDMPSPAHLAATNDAPVAGATVISGISDDLGGESGCGMYNINDFGCTVPYGWSGVFTPQLDGYRFEPRPS